MPNTRPSAVVAGGETRQAVRGRAGRQLGDPEVEHFDSPLGREHDVRRLDIAVDDLKSVSRADCIGQCDANFKQSIIGIPPRGINSRSVLPSTSSIVRKVQVLALLDRMNRDDVGVIERGDRACLARKPGATVSIGGALGRQNLDRHVPTEPWVMRAVDVAHPTGTDEGRDAVRPETRARNEARRIREGDDRPVEERVARGVRREQPRQLLL